MKITKRQLKRIIREEYSHLKKRALIRESNIGDEFAYKITELILHGQAKSAKQASSGSFSSKNLKFFDWIVILILLKLILPFTQKAYQ